MSQERFIPSSSSGRFYDVHTAETISESEMVRRMRNAVTEAAYGGKGFSMTSSSAIQVKADSPAQANRRIKELLPNVEPLPGETEGVKIIAAERVSNKQRDEAAAHVEWAKVEGYFLDEEEADKRIAYIHKAETAAQLDGITSDLKPMPKDRRGQPVASVSSPQQTDVSFTEFMEDFGKFIKAVFWSPFGAVLSFTGFSLLGVFGVLAFFHKGSTLGDYFAGGLILMLALVGLFFTTGFAFFNEDGNMKKK